MSAPAEPDSCSTHYDLVVLGSGPGGEGAAMQAAKAGLRVAVVERHHDVGGGCTHWGTIPSKALREAALYLTGANQRGLFGSTHHVTTL